MSINLLLILMLLVMTWCGAFGGYFLKLASDTDLKKELPVLVKWLIIGLLSYGSGAILNIIVLRYMPYTIVFPLTSITYIWTFVLSYFLLGEPITKRKLLGIGLIIIGAVCLVI